MSIILAVILGAVQGITEFLPVSSSGHLVVFQHYLAKILGALNAPLTFDVLVHLATGFATVFYLRSEVVYLRNVFSSTEAEKFDLGSYPFRGIRKHTFKTQGVFPMYCNVHAEMASCIAVSDGDWGKVTDSSGSFSFNAVPPGNYEVLAWNVRGSTKAQVRVQAGSNNKLSLTIEATSAGNEAHLNKYGQAYPDEESEEEIY